MTPPSTPSGPPAGATLADLGEFGLVSALADIFPAGEGVILGPGDDAAVVAIGDGRAVVSTDLMVETRHFRRDWAGAAEIGRRAIAQNLSDLNAMGGRATALTVGLAAPADLPVAWVLELATGMAEEAALVGASIVGGDLTSADQVMIAVTALGQVDGEPVRRGGARPGDVVAIAGRQGWAAAGLAVLARGFRSPRVLVEAYRRPEPPYAAGPEALRLGATAMIDVSDGLVADVGHLATASGVRVALDSGCFTLAEPMVAVGAALGVDPMRFVLGGGDDHALVATFPAGTVLPETWTVIGEVRDVTEGDDETPGVTVDGAAYEGAAGHTHF